MAKVSSPTLDSQKGNFEIARCWRHGQFWLWATWAQQSTLAEHSYSLAARRSTSRSIICRSLRVVLHALRSEETTFPRSMEGDRGHLFAYQ